MIEAQPSTIDAAKPADKVKDAISTSHITTVSTETTTTVTKTANAQGSHQRRARINDSLDLGGNAASANTANVGGQLQKIMNRPEVKSLLAQYGLN